MIREDGIPVGLGFGLAMNEKAMNSFAGMSEEEKKQVIEAARSVRSRHEMERLVDDLARAGQGRFTEI